MTGIELGRSNDNAKSLNMAPDDAVRLTEAGMDSFVLIAGPPAKAIAAEGEISALAAHWMRVRTVPVQMSVERRASGGSVGFSPYRSPSPAASSGGGNKAHDCARPSEGWQRR
jgi:hypothetical protein